MEPVGLRPPRNMASTGSILRRGFHVNHSSEFGADGRAKQLQRIGRKRLRFLDPCPLEAFERLDALGGVILHPLEDDYPVAGRLDAIGEDLEAVGLAKPELA
jgi:hypothetical protein